MWYLLNLFKKISCYRSWKCSSVSLNHVFGASFLQSQQCKNLDLFLLSNRPLKMKTFYSGCFSLGRLVFLYWVMVVRKCQMSGVKLWNKVFFPPQVGVIQQKFHWTFNPSCPQAHCKHNWLRIVCSDRKEVIFYSINICSHNTWLQSQIALLWY